MWSLVVITFIHGKLDEERLSRYQTEILKQSIIDTGNDLFILEDNNSGQILITVVDNKLQMSPLRHENMTDQMVRFFKLIERVHKQPRLALILGGHANGNDLLFGNEGKYQLNKIPIKGDILILDACHMATVNVCRQVVGKFKYLVASEDAVDFYGFITDQFCHNFGKSNSLLIAKRIVDRYFSYRKTFTSSNDYLSASVIDVKKAARIDPKITRVISEDKEYVLFDLEKNPAVLYHVNWFPVGHWKRKLNGLAVQVPN